MPRANTPGSQQTTRDRIKQTFLALYRKQPLSDIFVSDLAQQCSISRGTFYFYYENMEQLYHECETDLIRAMETGLDQVVLCSVGGKPENLDLFIETYSRHLTRYREFIPLYHCLLEGSEKASFHDRWVGSVASYFAQTLRFSSNIPPIHQTYLNHFFAGGEVAMLTAWVLNDCRDAPEDIAACSARALFTGSLFSR